MSELPDLSFTDYIATRLRAEMDTRMDEATDVWLDLVFTHPMPEAERRFEAWMAERYPPTEGAPE